MGKGQNGCSQPLPPASELAQLGQWLSELPAEAEVQWDETSMSDDLRYANGWMDLALRSGDQSAPVMLTVVSPGAAQSADDVEVERDGQLVARFENGQVAELALEGPSGKQTLIAPSVTEDIEANWNFFWRARMERKDGPENRWSMPVWTESAVQRLLDNLAQLHGRDDLRFTFSAQELPPLDDDPADDDELYVIGDGLQATGQAFDQLLGMDSESAAAITGELQQMRQKARQQHYRPGE